MPFFQTARCHVQDVCNVDENVMFHKMQEVVFHDNMSSTNYHTWRCVSC